jgi:hypothetical protein
MKDGSRGGGSCQFRLIKPPDLRRLRGADIDQALLLCGVSYGKENDLGRILFEVPIIPVPKMTVRHVRNSDLWWLNRIF